MNNIEILQPGLLTTVQDDGRWGYQKYGMPVAGAMDQLSLNIANLLVGNEPNEAVLEATMMGPKIKFNTEEIISITGADMDPKINNRKIPMWQSIKIRPGDILSFSGSKDGLRTYIAFKKILDIPVIMNSKSTFLRGEIGGYKGRSLKAGDIIDLKVKELTNNGSKLSSKYITDYRDEDKIRVVLGPQDDHFNQENIDKFFESTYSITTESDRMGYRLDGPKIEHKDGADIISDGISFGSIQIPGHGSPIIMMADRQTTGGYTKIGTVITPDLSILAQMKPNTKIKFENISIEEAQNEYLNYKKKLEEIRKDIEANRFEYLSQKQYRLNIDSEEFVVDIVEIE